MAWSNKHSLPIEICNALTRNRYSGDVPSESQTQKTDFSVTQLISPVQQTILKKRYPDAGQNDVIENLWSMFGSIAHQLLEEHGSDDAQVEQRYYTQILGKTISGGIDHIKSGVITDYKVTSVWKVMKKNYEDYEKQLNAYAYILKQNNIEVNSIRIIAILRDWSEPDGYKPDYPKAPIQIIDIPLWPEYKQAMYLAERVKLLKQAEQSTDDSLIECTLEEMWSSPSKWCVYKTLDSKRATKLFDSEQEAIDSGLEGVIVERKGERRRCNKYCQVSECCIQFKKFKEELDGAGSGQLPF